jgi:hypothetical protein
MTSDSSLEELHEFARRMGLEREWYQDRHYDITASMKRRALLIGAREVDSHTMMRAIQKLGV